jgi:hypothetical protein
MKAIARAVIFLSRERNWGRRRALGVGPVVEPDAGMGYASVLRYTEAI